MKVAVYPKLMDAVRKKKQIAARNDLDFILTSYWPPQYHLPELRGRQINAD
jgi:hypothetical protein